jgi:hypothetical protein
MLTKKTWLKIRKDHTLIAVIGIFTVILAIIALSFGNIGASLFLMIIGGFLVGIGTLDDRISNEFKKVTGEEW